MPDAIVPQQMVYQYLKNGGSADMNVDGSVTPVKFTYTATADETHIHYMNFTLIDSAMQYEKFGGLPELANGVTIKAIDSDEDILLDITNGNPLTVISDFQVLAGVDAVGEFAAGEDALPVQLTFPRPMHLGKNERIEIEVQDDLTGLTKFRCMVQGVQIRPYDHGD